MNAKKKNGAPKGAHADRQTPPGGSRRSRTAHAAAPHRNTEPSGAVDADGASGSFGPDPGGAPLPPRAYYEEKLRQTEAENQHLIAKLLSLNNEVERLHDTIIRIATEGRP